MAESKKRFSMRAGVINLHDVAWPHIATELVLGLGLELSEQDTRRVEKLQVDEYCLLTFGDFGVYITRNK